ncbi:MAG: tetratricopeptide repeat protein [Candidatus Melainabacteria bacterium]|nr:MAG: tetratricopeptide repeat protein [Candidatus Melainabacteria bacterium]
MFNSLLQQAKQQVVRDQSANLDEQARNKRIVDARIFRQRTSSKYSEQTLRLDHANLNQVWTECVAEAKEVAAVQNYERAEELLKQSIQYSTNAQQLAFSTSFLAEIYYQQHQYEKAEPLSLKVLALYRQNQDSTNRADLATALHNTAFLYQAMKRFDLAEKHYLEAVQVRSQFMEGTDALMVALIEDYKSCVRERNRTGNPCTKTIQFLSQN